MAEEKAEQIKVMVVGASVVVAEPVTAVLARTPGIAPATQAADGVDAVSRLRQTPFDVIFVDIGDPKVKLATDLSRILRVDPDAQIVLVATLTFANVKNAMAAKVKGATEFIQAPARHTHHISPEYFSRRIADLAGSLGRARKQRGTRPAALPKPSHDYAVPKSLRPLPRRRPKAIAVASSTVGPQALFALFSNLPQPVDQPIFVTQHMPPGFTRTLADHLQQWTEWPCKEAEDGDLVQPGRISLAPGDFYMTVERGGRGPTVRINQGPQKNYCRPSAEPMLRSIIDVYSA